MNGTQDRAGYEECTKKTIYETQNDESEKWQSGASNYQ